MTLKRGAIESIGLKLTGTLLLFFMHSILGNFLGTYEYGVFAFVVGTSLLLASFSPLGWHILVVRFIQEYMTKHKWGYLKGLITQSRQITLSTSVLLSILLIFISYTPFISDLKKDSFIYIAILLPLMAISLLRRRMFVGFAHVRGSTIPEEVLLPLIMLIACVSLNEATRDANTYILYYMVTYAFVAIFGHLWLKSILPAKIKVSEKKTETRLWMSIALPMMVSSIGQALISQSGVMILGMVNKFSDTGMYAISFRLSLLIAFTMTAINAIGTPLLAKAFHSENHATFRSIYFKTLKWSATGGLLIYLPLVYFSEFILAFFGNEFIPAKNILVILATGQLISVFTGLAGSALVVIGKERIFAYIVFTIALIQFILGVVVSHKFGAFGMALVTSCSIALLNITAFYFVIRDNLRS